MAKEESISGYFRPVFAEHPEWLNEKSNALILERYRVDHHMAPGAPIDERIKQNLANLKSNLRKQARGKRRGRPPKVKTAATPITFAAPGMRRVAANRLEMLEEMIDDCLTLARNEDKQGLHVVIQLLRRARNNVVWQLGE